MTIADRCRAIIQTADPSVRLDGLTEQDLTEEALNVAEVAVEQMRESESQQKADRTSGALLLVPESVLAEYGVSIQGLETYDSNPTIAHFDAFPIVKKHVKHQGLRIGLTHLSGQDHRFGMPMQVDYGHLMGSYGAGDDGQAHDFLVGKDPTSEKLYAIQQLNPETGEKDERKFGVHFPDAQSFKAAYQKQLPNSLKDKLFGGVWEVPVEDFQQYREDSYHADACGCETCEVKREAEIKKLAARKKKRKPASEPEEGDRADAKKRLWVKDPTAKGGGYWQNREVKDPTPTPSAAPHSEGAAAKHAQGHGKLAQAGHIALHLGENVLSWKVGKVVGGAIGVVASHHGVNPEAARLISESSVQALTATALFARHPENRAPEAIATKFVSEISAAFAGKIAHGAVDQALSGGDPHVEAIGATVAGKGVGITTVQAVGRTLKKQGQVLKGLLDRRNGTVSHADDATGDAELTAEEKEAIFDLSLAGYILSGKQQENDRADADGSKPYLVWFEGRRTAIAVRATNSSEAETKARKLKRRGGDTVVKVRQATPEEQKTAASGRWIRTGPDGQRAGYNPSKKGFGPAPKRDSGDREPESEEEGDRADAEGNGERCGNGWITRGEECHAGASQSSQIRVPAGADATYVMFKSQSLGNGTKFTGIANPERDLARQFYKEGLTNDLNPRQLEMLRQNPKAIVASIEGWDREARSLLTKAKENEGLFAARQTEALENSVKINSILRREFIAATTGEKVDPYIGGNALYGFRAIKDKRGIQNVANVAYQANGSTIIYLMAAAPHNLSVNGIWKPYHGDDAKALAKVEARRSPGSSIAMLEGLIRENLAKGGTGQMECAPLDLNKPLFQRAGFRENDNDEFVLSPEAARKFLDAHDRAKAKKDSEMDDAEAKKWLDELIALEEETGGMMVLTPKKRGKSDRPTTDADDQNTADYLREVAQEQTAPVFKRWIERSLQWLKGFDSIGSLQSAFKKPATFYEALDADELEELLYQYMMLADLSGRVDVLDDDGTREDAAKPAWLKLPFAEAIAALRKRVTIPASSYKKMDEGYHSWAFSVARMTKANMVDDAKWIVDKGVSDGYDYDKLTKMWQRLIGRKGWDATGNQIYTILDTNIRAAYSTGRAQQVFDPESMRKDDVIVWRHRDSRVPRPLHLALHDKAIAASDPFWAIAFPSCAWGCRCSAFKVSRSYAERNGIEVLEKAPDPETIAEPGFRFNRAGLSDDDRQNIINSTLATLSPEVRKKVEADLKKR